MAKKGKKRTPASGDVATNRRARHKFEVVEKLEAGIELRGSEVKSLRNGKAQLADAYAVVERGEVWLRNLHIPPYEPASRENHEPERPRKLLLHRAEIERLLGKTAQRGLTLVPTRVYFKGPGEGRAGAGAGQGGAGPPARDRRAGCQTPGRARIQRADQVASGTMSLDLAVYITAGTFVSDNIKYFAAGLALLILILLLIISRRRRKEKAPKPPKPPKQPKQKRRGRKAKRGQKEEEAQTPAPDTVVQPAAPMAPPVGAPQAPGAPPPPAAAQPPATPGPGAPAGQPEGQPSDPKQGRRLAREQQRAARAEQRKRRQEDARRKKEERRLRRSERGGRGGRPSRKARKESAKAERELAAARAAQERALLESGGESGQLAMPPTAVPQPDRHPCPSRALRRCLSRLRRRPRPRCPPLPCRLSRPRRKPPGGPAGRHVWGSRRRRTPRARQDRRDPARGGTDPRRGRSPHRGGPAHAGRRRGPHLPGRDRPGDPADRRRAAADDHAALAAGPAARPAERRAADPAGTRGPGAVDRGGQEPPARDRRADEISGAARRGGSPPGAAEVPGVRPGRAPP